MPLTTRTSCDGGNQNNIPPLKKLVNTNPIEYFGILPY